MKSLIVILTLIAFFQLQSCRPLDTVWETCKTCGKYAYEGTKTLLTPAYNALETTVVRTGNTLKASYHFAILEGEQGMSCLGASFLNPLGTATQLVKDVSGIIPAVTGVATGFRKSDSVNFCTTGLAAQFYNNEELEIFDPTMHVGAISIDGFQTRDPGGGDMDYHVSRDCTPALIPMNMSENKAMQRFQCAQNNFRRNYHHYSFFNYNCGGWTEDVFEIAGFKVPQIPNLGIGSTLSTECIFSPEEYERREEIKEKVKKYCADEDKKINKLFKMIDDGKKIESTYLKKFISEGDHRTTFSSGLLSKFMKKLVYLDQYKQKKYTLLIKHFNTYSYELLSPLKNFIKNNSYKQGKDFKKWLNKNKKPFLKVFPGFSDLYE